MKGNEWSRLISRLMCFIALINLAITVAIFSGLYFVFDRSFSNLETYFMSALAGQTLLLFAAGFVWAFGGKFKFSSSDNSEANWDSKKFALFAVATIGIFFFLQEIASGLSLLNPTAFRSTEWFIEQTLPRIISHLMTVSLAILIIKNSNTLAVRITR